MKMQHVTIHTACYKESIKFYEEIAGLTIKNELAGGPHRITFLANAEGETAVEILEDPDAAYAGSGISMGFQVEDVKAYHEKLKKAGFAVSPLISPNSHVTFFFTKDPNGVEIQFI